jgi:UDP-glucose 4-epimerase
LNTLIIGKNSNLSYELFKIIPDCILLSSRDLSSNIDLLAPYKQEKINLIFNNFQTAVGLNDVTHIDQYIENALGITAKILAYFQETKIQKIIYTSSSSVYGNNIFCNEHDEVRPLSLHASLKVSNEKLIETYCKKHDINYTIARIFNMYGANDQFSIISKIINAHQCDTELTIINNGNAIRDFIHIDDVVHTYSKILVTDNLPLINIGSGNGTSIKSILEFLKNHHIHLKTQTLQRDELKTSTANNAIMITLLHTIKFKEVESYLLDQLTKSQS